MKLTVNGVEVTYDPTKLLEIILDTGPDPVAIGPVRIVAQGGYLRIQGNANTPEALFLGRLKSPYDGKLYMCELCSFGHEMDKEIGTGLAWGEDHESH